LVFPILNFLAAIMFTPTLTASLYISKSVGGSLSLNKIEKS